ncbi:hypothetical protein BGZ80_000140 [Entomortierella chlamydospora]|uniref:Uncharacterized protein n=1 Tax=Entomortierella chlamydospora TaxID=101097 RepID=A0A9P6MTV5_9FUNG|nr:hypothetical protein BGZ80_000140 [Entomortierella chlamydospora]
MALFSGIPGAKWLPCAVHKVKITINNAWKEGGALPLLDKYKNIPRMFKNRDAVADQLAKSQQTAAADDIKPITMNETRWNSRYEMVKWVIILKDYIDGTISHSTNSTSLLLTHISLDKLKGCSLSYEGLNTACTWTQLSLTATLSPLQDEKKKVTKAAKAA